jgi:hypothetical protein
VTAFDQDRDRTIPAVQLRRAARAGQGESRHQLLKDPALEDADSLLPPEVIAQTIVEDLEAALSEFAAIAEALQPSRTKTPEP